MNSFMAQASSTMGCNGIATGNDSTMGGCRERLSEIAGMGKGPPTDAGDLSGHSCFSIGGDLRPDVSDAPCCIVDPIEYRGRLRPGRRRGTVSLLHDRPRLPRANWNTKSSCPEI